LAVSYDFQPFMADVEQRFWDEISAILKRLTKYQIRHFTI